MPPGAPLAPRPAPLAPDASLLAPRPSPLAPQPSPLTAQPSPVATFMPCPVGPPGMEMGVPLPYTPIGPWQPPGIASPWPPDEFIVDGGNAGPPIRVTRQGEIRGLQMEDTIAHFNTLDGRTLVEPSNTVYLYAPRFGAVRQVINAKVDQQRDRAAGVYKPASAAVPKTSEVVVTSAQDFQPIDEVGRHPAELDAVTAGARRGGQRVGAARVR